MQEAADLLTLLNKKKKGGGEKGKTEKKGTETEKE